MNALVFVIAVVLAAGWAAGEELPFHDPLLGELASGWKWIREVADGHRVTDQGLEIRVMPGNMWGPANDARNVLVRHAPPLNDLALEVTVFVENGPTEQYEQVDLVWYYADTHMVKLGQELVDGQLSIVMGREENDRTRTINIIPLKTHRVGLRLLVEAERIVGYFQADGTQQWQKAGACDLPRLQDAPAQISIQAYQGPADKEHWARIRDFQVQRIRAKPDK